MNFFTKFVLGLIVLYQKTLSPDHGLLRSRFPYGYCKFYPSCSEYSKQAFTKFGLIKGFYLTLNRIVKCHPWAKPKIDHIP
jgi:putative membrane protein insertion efficiency factor